MVFARRTAAHVDHLAGKGDGLGRVSPVQGPLEVVAHALEKLCLTGVLAVPQLAGAAAPESLEQAMIDRGGRANPFGVGMWETVGAVDPSPHDQTTGQGKQAGVDQT
jgi:hypothetical protein